jgi:hypothetical protein
MDVPCLIEETYINKQGHDLVMREILSEISKCGTYGVLII